jgi:hypothetical protein
VRVLQAAGADSKVSKAHCAAILAPRARDPPELDAGFAFLFDQSPGWDPAAAPHEPRDNLDQTVN